MDDVTKLGLAFCNLAKGGQVTKLGSKLGPPSEFASWESNPLNSLSLSHDITNLAKVTWPHGGKALVEAHDVEHLQGKH